MKNRPIRIAVVGLGWVSTHRHLPVLQRDARFQIVGLIDRRADRVQSVAAQFGIERTAVTGDIAQVPWLSEIDAVTVATSPRTHFPVISAALDAGKHVLTEKPFALSVEEGRILVEKAEKRGLILSIVHNFQFATSFLKLQRDIRLNRLGQITSVQAIQFSNPNRRLPVWYEELPLGLFYDESPHLLYLLQALAPGGLSLQSADAAREANRQTPALLNARFEGQIAGKTVPMALSFNFVASLSEWQLLVWGTRRCGVVDVFRDIYLRLPNDGLHTTKTVLRTSVAAAAQHFGQHFSSGIAHLRGELFYGNPEVFARFAHAIASGQPPRGTSAQNALQVLQWQHEIAARLE